MLDEEPFGIRMVARSALKAGRWRAGRDPEVGAQKGSRMPTPGNRYPRWADDGGLA